MSNLSDASHFAKDLERIPTQRALAKAINESAVFAQRNVIEELAQMQRQCGLFGSGAASAYDAVSRQGHLAAFEMMTYAEVCASVGARSNAECEQLMEAGKAIQARVLHHEQLYLADALSPSDVFYDDLLPPVQIDAEHISAGYIRTLGQQPAFNEADDTSNNEVWADQPAMAG